LRRPAVDRIERRRQDHRYFAYGPDGEPELIKDPKLLLNDDNAAKVEGIHLMIGRTALFAFGNSTGDQEMFELVRRLSPCATGAAPT
jgi:hypothetical protein